MNKDVTNRWYIGILPSQKLKKKNNKCLPTKTKKFPTMALNLLYKDIYWIFEYIITII